MSMLLGCGSDAGQSMEINAMAMKYLKDEQLTHLARLRQASPGGGSVRGRYTDKILQKVISSHGR